ncbi:MAG TPA: SpoIIE family protein phosphatase [Phycisphaerae bacterium]|nr:SpoIIE family protein phosphatase [Phycisphaerae bacterium]HPP27281.1 SpoIIE family protein phosphatase [Phycisphaerae bacterium]HQE27477.1 SpoIIE family protein phosphatase [Phycisphaerae bacterium]
MTYLHLDITDCQTPKRAGNVCGDAWSCLRTERSTTIICCDGIGSGIKANIAATMTIARLEELLRRDCSLRQAVAGVAATMDRAKLTDLPYTAFCVARVLNDGEATILSYEIPRPVLIGRRLATELPQRTLTLDRAIINESCCYLEPGDALVLVTDGIAQAGLGVSLREGWQTQGLCRFINDRIHGGTALNVLPRLIVHEAQRISRDPQGIVRGDDCTVVLCQARSGNVVNILTGPPAQKTDDTAVARAFVQLEGKKVVCGGTTAKLVSQQLKRRLAVGSDTSMIAPPDYRLDGIDLATEGAVTLNQAYNILDEDPRRYERDTGVTRLCEMLRGADYVRFIVGTARNDGHGDISFRQRGILHRHTIVSLLADKLRTYGKLVTIESTDALIRGGNIPSHAMNPPSHATGLNG